MASAAASLKPLSLIALSADNTPIRMESIAVGRAMGLPVPIRDIARFALDSNAAALIIAHNHPGGTFEPSVSDMQMQRAVYEGLNTLSIKLEYNFIVARGQARCIFDRNNMIGI